MTQQLVQGAPAGPLAAFADRLPPMIASADDRTAWRFVDFFAVTIRNPNTREAYYRAVSRFMDWCEHRGLNRLDAIRPMSRAGGVPRSKPSLTSPKQLGPAPQWPGMTAPDGGLVPLRQAPCTHSLGADPRPPGLLRPAGSALHRPGGGADPDPGMVCAPLANRGHPVSGTGRLFQEVRTHLGVETQRQWSDQAIARTTPVLVSFPGPPWPPTRCKTAIQ